MDSLAYILGKWKIDPDALKTLPVEIPNTSRNDLALLFAELGLVRGVELGTAGGRFAEVLCKSNPGSALYCVDPYAIYNGYRDYTRTEEMAVMRQEAHARLMPFGVTFIEEFGLNALSYFPDGSLDFVYIDANHEWPYVTQDIYYWAKKVRPGGIVSGHDFYRSSRKDSKCHVKGAVQGYTFAFKISPWFLLGRNERRPGEVRERSRSWFWVKE